MTNSRKGSKFHFNLKERHWKIKTSSVVRQQVTYSYVPTDVNYQVRNCLQFSHPFIYYHRGNHIYRRNIFSQERGSVLVFTTLGSINCFRKSKNFLLIGSYGATLLRLSDGKEVPFNVDGQMNGVSFSNDETKIYISAQSSMFQVFMIGERKSVPDRYKLLKPRKIYQHSMGSYANDAMISKNGRYIACPTDGRGYFVFEDDGENIKLAKHVQKQGHGDLCSFNCDDSLLIVCGSRNISVFSTHKMNEIHRIYLEKSVNSMCSVAKFSPVNKNLFTFMTVSDGIYLQDLGKFDPVDPWFKKDKLNTVMEFKNSTKTHGMCWNEDGSSIFVSTNRKNCHEFELHPKFYMSTNTKWFRRKLLTAVDGRKYCDVRIILLGEE